MSTILIVGASRGLGLGLAREYAQRGWQVIGTRREGRPAAGLEALAAERPEQVRVETCDIDAPDEVAALRRRLDGQSVDLLFVNAGVSNGQSETVAHSSQGEFIRVLVTNAWSPLRVIEAFEDLVPPAGAIAAMSSGLGSVANNTRAGWEVYRASKAALNTMLRSFAVRHGQDRAVLAVAPGWVRTDMGGPGATLDVETSVRGMADAITARQGQPGSAFVSYNGQDLPW